MTAARLRGLGSFGEQLPDDLRALCRDVWRLPLADIYSCEEVGYIALQCPQVPEHYHVQAENLYSSRCWTATADRARPAPPARWC